MYLATFSTMVLVEHPLEDLSPGQLDLGHVLGGHGVHVEVDPGAAEHLLEAADRVEVGVRFGLGDLVEEDGGRVIRSVGQY